MVLYCIGTYKGPYLNKQYLHFVLFLLHEDGQAAILRPSSAIGNIMTVAASGGRLDFLYDKLEQLKMHSVRESSEQKGIDGDGGQGNARDGVQRYCKPILRQTSHSTNGV